MLCDKLYRLRFDVDRCLPQFVSFYLGSTPARGQVELDATGASASMVNISQSAILDLMIAAPPLSEQEDIVRFIASQVELTERLIFEAAEATRILLERRATLISAAVTGQIDVRRIAAVEPA
jgi:type I restriction enzyme, S subunit